MTSGTWQSGVRGTANTSNQRRVHARGLNFRADAPTNLSAESIAGEERQHENTLREER